MGPPGKEEQGNFQNSFQFSKKMGVPGFFAWLARKGRQLKVSAFKLVNKCSYRSAVKKVCLPLELIITIPSIIPFNNWKLLLSSITKY
jgi:hypothetical protein